MVFLEVNLIRVYILHYYWCGLITKYAIAFTQVRKQVEPNFCHFCTSVCLAHRNYFYLMEFKMVDHSR